jgi:bifunctional NMN adenylyltransferase/nudix hydrolase
MSKKYDMLVFIGRFSPMHNGHKAVINHARNISKQTMVIVGSSFAPRNTRNPFTFEERKRMIKSEFPTDDVSVVPIVDYPYDDNKWVAAIQSLAYGNMKWSADPVKIGLIGHSKDSSSYYLKIFPRWDNVEVPVQRDAGGDVYNATEVRDIIFNSFYMPSDEMPPSSFSELKRILTASVFEFDSVRHETDIMEKYKKSWENSPYPPIHHTTDTVVTQSGHVLLVKRKASPGKGQWALPGGFLNADERLREGAIRELKEETKIDIPIRVLNRAITEEKTFDHPYRSTRGRTITTAFHMDLGFSEKLPKVTAADDAEAVKWIEFAQVKREEMFEDHYSILDYFLNIG